MRWLVLFLLLSLGFGLGSCGSPSKAISAAATNVIHEATASKADANQIVNKTSQPEAVELANSIDGRPIRFTRISLALRIASLGGLRP